jgi:hypothetical protein
MQENPRDAPSAIALLSSGFLGACNQAPEGGMNAATSIVLQEPGQRGAMRTVHRFLSGLFARPLRNP